MLEVICAGFGRAGTLSLKAALETLGHSPCWHIEDMFIGVGIPASHLDAWHRLSQGGISTTTRGPASTPRHISRRAASHTFRRLAESVSDVEFQCTVPEPSTAMDSGLQVDPIYY